MSEGQHWAKQCPQFTLQDKTEGGELSVDPHTAASFAHCQYLWPSGRLLLLLQSLGAILFIVVKNHESRIDFSHRQLVVCWGEGDAVPTNGQ